MPKRPTHLFALLLTLTVAAAWIAARQIPARAGAARPPDPPPTTQVYAAVESDRLHNAHHVTDKVISGAQPEDDEGFAALRELGVRTIISVDGARPNVAGAREYGMRYIHLPMRYDGVEHSTAMALAKAIAEMPGRIYIHCHHGRHRSAAAVAVACVINGSIQPDGAESVLRTFGTGANYTGLWRAAREARPVNAQVLRDLDVDYVETAEVPPLADVMVAVDRHWEHLKLTQSDGWQVPDDHPDLDPPHEALQLEEHFHEIGRSEAIAQKPARFIESLRHAEESARRLKEALRADPLNRPHADAAARLLGESCISCHQTFRD